MSEAVSEAADAAAGSMAKTADAAALIVPLTPAAAASAGAKRAAAALSMAPSMAAISPVEVSAAAASEGSPDSELDTRMQKRSRIDGEAAAGPESQHPEPQPESQLVAPEVRMVEAAADSVFIPATPAKQARLLPASAAPEAEPWLCSAAGATEEESASGGLGADTAPVAAAAAAAAAAPPAASTGAAAAPTAEAPRQPALPPSASPPASPAPPQEQSQAERSKAEQEQAGQEQVAAPADRHDSSAAPPADAELPAVAHQHQLEAEVAPQVAPQVAAPPQEAVAMEAAVAVEAPLRLEAPPPPLEAPKEAAVAVDAPQAPAEAPQEAAAAVAPQAAVEVPQAAVAAAEAAVVVAAAGAPQAAVEVPQAAEAAAEAAVVVAAAGAPQAVAAAAVPVMQFGMYNGRPLTQLVLIEPAPAGAVTPVSGHAYLSGFRPVWRVAPATPEEAAEAHAALMEFGMHAGRRIADLPPSYVAWACRQPSFWNTDYFRIRRLLRHLEVLGRVGYTEDGRVVMVAGGGWAEWFAEHPLFELEMVGAWAGGAGGHW
ncbi:hypothetical protein HXX76_010796 [Chlamydomonas incerta]|uniref:Uncharacterized protein n=1 Tax=Chlamydomonas incerta TaxID=51695 RepID=A0A835T0Z4_CHLIN|nr:hypothetical protein HXX76_010796 [Chlamydomonas incerta]|eukprot:KAG2429561.1 hypothetical protein HXX76_010796 [Chlamydomonas incerta]